MGGGRYQNQQSRRLDGEAEWVEEVPSEIKEVEPIGIPSGPLGPYFWFGHNTSHYLELCLVYILVPITAQKLQVQFY